MVTTTTFPGLVSIDPIQGLIDYVADIKPYHTKVFETLVEYVYTDFVNVSIVDLADFGGDVVLNNTTTNVGTYWYDSCTNILYIGATAEYVGSISGTTLTISSIISGTIEVGRAINGTNVLPGTIIESGSGLVWQVNNSQTVASTTLTSFYWEEVTNSIVVSITPPPSPSIGTIWYKPAQVATFTGSISGTALTITTITSGTVLAGMYVTPDFYSPPTIEVAPGTTIVSGSGLSWILSAPPPNVGHSVPTTSFTGTIPESFQVFRSVYNPTTKLTTSSWQPFPALISCSDPTQGDIQVTMTETSITEAFDFYEIAPTPPTALIIAADTTNNVIYFTGDLTSQVASGYIMNINGSSGNNNNYDVLNVAYTGTQTAVVAVIIGTSNPIASSSVGDTATFYSTDITYNFGYPIVSFDMTPVLKIDTANPAAITELTSFVLSPSGPPNYLAGEYDNVPLSGSATGFGAEATIIVTDTTSGDPTTATVTNFLITNPGMNYGIGDVLTASAFQPIGYTGTVSGTIPSSIVTRFVLLMQQAPGPGLGYSVGDLLSVNNSYLGGVGSGLQIQVTSVAIQGYITSISVVSPGTGYINGTYRNIPLIGGTGTGAIAYAIVVGGISTLVKFSTQTIVVQGNLTTGLHLNATRAIQPGSIFRLKTPLPNTSVNDGIYYAVYVQYDPLVNTTTIGVGLPSSGQPTTPLFNLLTTNTVGTGQLVIPYNITGYDGRYDAPYDGMAGYHIVSG